MVGQFHLGEIADAQIAAELVQADALAQRLFAQESLVVGHGVHKLLVTGRPVLLL